MGWIISKALYEKWPCSQERAVESLEDTCSDGKQSAPLNGNHTQPVYLSPDKMTAFSRLSRFGMMCKPLTADRGEDLLTWYRGDFLAKTYPRLEREKALPERVAVCGRTWHELSEKFDLDSCSWKIHHSLFPVELDWSSVILPRWGMTVSGQLYQHQTSERPISATGSGLWATPTTMDKLPPKSEAALHREATVARPGRSKPANLRDQVSNMENWPTPRSCSAMAAAITPESSWNQDRFPNLETMVGRRTWPTPQARDYKGSSGRSMKGEECDLPTAVKTWPTPSANDNRDRGNLGSPAIQRRIEKGKQIMLSMSVSDISGALNPLWVEWLMGWPLGWTDLKPLGTDKFHAWLEQHSIS